MKAKAQQLLHVLDTVVFRNDGCVAMSHENFSQVEKLLNDILGSTSVFDQLKFYSKRQKNHIRIPRHVYEIYLAATRAEANNPE